MPAVMKIQATRVHGRDQRAHAASIRPDNNAETEKAKFTPLGVDPYEDGAQLFKEACFTWVMAAIVVLVHRAPLLDLARQVLARLAPAAANR